VDATSLLLIAAGYGLGSIPFGVLLTQWKGLDVRAQGSGNIGATNVARVAGKKLGVAVLALDAGKGALAVWLAQRVAPDAAWLHAEVGLAAFAGHVLPVWLKFRGGKGVATALGVLGVLVPWAALAGFVTYAAVFAAFRISSVGSLLGAGVALATAFSMGGAGAYSLLTALLFVLMLVTHRSNIGRILKRAEKGL